ncbi:hypothetical protein CMEL01_10069 [Colletotrichum melonis]|uniref:Zn(2)-C6 fungal-type domain-containing protein n=1 Tax=Colletotrichum melonis TaxID=1209925 RepID=A0AAI9TUC8_9PEZI|nr:hypothetical protein CMEL01_10069 [Colletotrichum melonis]
MSVREDLSGIEPEGPPAADLAGSRVWRACLACRRKKVCFLILNYRCVYVAYFCNCAKTDKVMKIKCDGKQPCHNCSSRDQSCEFPGTKDNASASRYYVTSFEARCQQMDTLCQRLEVLTGQLSQSVDVLNKQPPAPASQNQPSGRVSAAEIINSFPRLAALLSQATASPRQESITNANPNAYAGVAELDVNTGAIDDETEVFSPDNSEDYNDDSTSVESTFRLTKPAAEELSQAGALVRDSYGRLRFVGGAASNLIVEAARNLLPNLATTMPSSTGASHETPNLPDLEIPSFVRGKLWPPLPYIPAPESLPRPPQYVSDLLVSLYFDKLHYIFPILIKPHFMNRYQKLLRAGPDSSSPKRGRFLMVFFAVCACASGLLPSNLESGLPGIDFYQKALLILTTSICLGRPLAVKDEDCYCELPLDVRDEDVMSGIKSGHAVDVEATTSSMSGFLAFAKLCRLAGKIQEFSSPLNLQKIASADAERTHRFLARVDAHDQALRKWLESLPGEIQFSANRKNKSHGDISMVHCVITFFLHAGSLINLYRYFLNYPKDSAERDEVDVSGAIDQCINAARGCIYVADMVRDLVPASHHLAICIHYLTLSGIILLRVPIDRSNPALLEDAEKCARSLKDLEPRWSGAKRSREIIEKLLDRRRSEIAGDSLTCRGNEGRHSPENARRADKRPFADVEVASSSLVDVASGIWNPSTTGSMPETTHYDGCMDPMLFASWSG